MGVEIISEVQKLLQSDRVDEAEIMLKKNKKQLDFDSYHAYLGLCLELKHKYHEAIKTYDQIQYVGETISPKFYYHHLAFCLNSLGKYSQALANLVKIEDSLTKKDIGIHWQFFATYRILNQPMKALDHIEIVSRATKDFFYQIYYAQALNDVERYEDAYRLGKKLAKKQKKDSQVIRVLAKSSYHLKKYEESEGYFYQLIEMGSSCDNDFLYLANIYILKDRYREALTTLKKIKKKDSQVCVKIAFCYGSLGREKMAIHFYEKAIKENPQNVGAIRSLSTYYRMVGKYQEAIKVLKTYHSLVPDASAIVYYEMSLVESDRGNYKKSISYLEKAKKEENLPLYDCDIAWNYKQLENYPKAIRFLEKVKLSYPNDAWVLHELGYCQAKLGQEKEALENYRKVNFTNPEIDRDRYFYELGILEFSCGNTEKAYHAFLQIQQKDDYTYAHLVECSFQLGEYEDMDNWMSMIPIKKEKDPWFDEIYLDYLEGKKEYQAMDSWLEERKKKIPRLLYLRKKIQILLALSYGDKDPKLKEAEKMQRKILSMDSNNDFDILTLAMIYNRLGRIEEAKAYLVELEKRGFHSPNLKREWVYSYSLSPSLIFKKEALAFAKDLYNSTLSQEDYYSLMLQYLNLGCYWKVLWMTRKFSKDSLWRKKIEVIRGICYNKIGFTKYAEKVLKPWRESETEIENSLISRYLNEGGVEK